MISDTLAATEIQNAYRKILGFVDLTTLQGTDNRSVVEKLCSKALSFQDDSKSIPAVAAVCVYPVFAGQVASALSGSGIQTACVAGAFPSGQSPLSVRLDEARYAIDEGADEIDMVISRGRFMDGDISYIREEVSEFKKVCGEGVHLKVILETGELQEEKLIREASRISMEAGADFIKTSTGKVKPAATLEAFYFMLDEIKKFYAITSKKVGIKPAGGISDAATSLKYYALLKAMLGNDWLDKSLFRIGASSLTDSLMKEII